MRLTDPAFTHVVSPASVSPDGRYFVDVYQTHDTPPATPAARFAHAAGRGGPGEERSHQVSDRLGLKKAELFTLSRRRRQDELFGRFSFRRISIRARSTRARLVYGGPGVRAATCRARPSSVRTRCAEYGFLSSMLSYSRRARAWASVARRALPEARRDRDRRPWRPASRRSAIAAVRRQERVGIFGTSYGGYASIHRRCCAIPTSSRPPPPRRRRPTGGNYDTIYTERYMWTPQENKDGLRRRHRDDLRGQPEGAADALLRHGRQQRPPGQHAAAHQGPAAGRQELRGAGRARPGPLGDQRATG